MYKVGIYLRVRKACFVEGMSVREAARVFGLHRDTVRKMLEYSVPPGYRRQRPARRPKLDPYKGVMDQILEQDLTSPKKQRHTAKRIYERLRDEHGFPGKYTIVKDYVSRTPSSYPRDVLTSVPPSGTCPVRLRRSSSDHRRSGTQSPLLRPGPPSQRWVLCEGVSLPRPPRPSVTDTFPPLRSWAGCPRALCTTTPPWRWPGYWENGRRRRTRVFTELQSHYLFEDRFWPSRQRERQGQSRRSGRLCPPELPGAHSIVRELRCPQCLIWSNTASDGSKIDSAATTRR